MLTELKTQRPLAKTALVLAGGGLTGAVYEIGALMALQDLTVGHTANDFDIYVGTSAGAILASLLANGMHPAALLQSIAGKHRYLPLITPNVLFHVNYLDFVKYALGLPRRLLGALGLMARHPREATLYDLIWTFGEGLPAGLCDNAPIAEYIREVLEHHGYSNDFRKLPRELHIIATQLDNGARAAFSRHWMDHVPISQAVAASTALPVLYKPVEIDGHDYVDGAARANASLDLAIERGAKLVICINPLVPFDHASPSPGRAEEPLSKKGLTAIVKQLARIQTHAGLEYHIKQLRRRNRDVDILLIEPRATDYEMFQYNMMSYGSRMTVAQHSYERVSVQLATAYVRYSRILARHGIVTRRTLSTKQLRKIHRANYDAEVIRDCLPAPAVG